MRDDGCMLRGESSNVYWWDKDAERGVVKARGCPVAYPSMSCRASVARPLWRKDRSVIRIRTPSGQLWDGIYLPAIMTSTSAWNSSSSSWSPRPSMAVPVLSIGGLREGGIPFKKMFTSPIMGKRLRRSSPGDIFVPGAKSTKSQAAWPRTMNVNLSSSTCHFSGNAKEIGQSQASISTRSCKTHLASRIPLPATKVRWQ